MNEIRVDADDLERFVTDVFQHVGMRPADAALLGRSLVEADEVGVGTHGVGRVASYVGQLSSGQVAVRPVETVVADKPAAVLIDAGGGFGAPVGIRAVETAMSKAVICGVCAVGIRNVAHFGAAGYYTRHAAERGYLAIAMSSSSASVVPFGSREPRIGNSPMSFAAPGTTQGPELVMDMAQSMTSRGRIKVAVEQGRTIPPGWALDAQGSPTVDPREALAGGVLPSGGHKGSAMSLMVEMLASGLTGGHLTQEIQHAGFTASPTAGENSTTTGDVTVGNWFLVIDSNVFGAADAVRKNAVRIAEYVRGSAPAPGFDTVMAPGDPERRSRATAHRLGVLLRPSTRDELADLGRRFDLRPLTFATSADDAR